MGALKALGQDSHKTCNAAHSIDRHHTPHRKDLMSSNQLDQETSPYLLLHKNNPVHWRIWGPEALAEAESTGKPILLSIGYTACHWCHVMNRESFSDTETAALMNENFINIKVDREERPDLDQIYQAPPDQTLGQGGWPLTMFLTPKGVPFFAGTYFPKEERFGQPAFKTVLNTRARAFRDQNPGPGRRHRRARQRLARRLVEPPEHARVDRSDVPRQYRRRIRPSVSTFSTAASQDR